MIAYLINQYPQSSQSFIRREILALEKLGQPIERFTVRRWDVKLVDPGDIAEQQRTRVVLDVGALGLIGATLSAIVTRPMNFFRALATARRIGWRSQRGLTLHLIYLAEACVLLRWFARWKINHVHCHFGTNSTTVAMLTRVLGGPPYSFTIHGPEEWDSPKFLAIPEKIHRSKFAVVISSFSKSQACRWSDPRDWHKIQIIHCGLDEQFLDAPTTAPPAEPRLVCVGRFGETKGHLVLIEAAARLAREGIPFEIDLIGDGPMRPQIEAAIRANDLCNRIHLLGWKSNQDVVEAITRSRALVLPSFAEGLPVVFMESLAMERPVIATYVAGVPELVKDGFSGWLVPAGGIEPLVEAMRQALAASPQTLWEMGKAGREIVRQNHTAMTEARRLLDLIESQQ